MALNRSLRPLAVFFIYCYCHLHCVTIAVAGFTRGATYKFSRVEQSMASVWCYRPPPGAVRPGLCSNGTLAAALHIHTKNRHGTGLSIQYYESSDLSALGGAAWDVRGDTPLPIVLCLAGRINSEEIEGEYRTTCRFAWSNDDHDSRASHNFECTTDHSQERVTDGCYTPMRTSGFQLNNKATAILTIFGVITGVLSLPLMAWLAKLGWRRWKVMSKERAEPNSVQTTANALCTPCELPLVPLSHDLDVGASVDSRV